MHSLTVVLRQVDEASVTIVAQDTRTITAKRSGAIKVFKKGEEIGLTSLAKGDRVRIDATQDEQGFYHAVAIYLESEATAQDRSAAEAGTDPSTQKSDESDDRPILRRQPAPTDQAAETENADSSPKPDSSTDSERPARKVVIAENNPNDLDPDRRRLGEREFLLPVHAETLTCVRGTSNCSRNVIDFRNYRKYSWESTITFDK